MISVAIQTTAKQDAKLAKMLTEVNAERTTTGNPTYPTMDAYMTDVCMEAIKSWISSQDSKEGTTLSAAYFAATATVQANVRTALGI